MTMPEATAQSLQTTKRILIGVFLYSFLFLTVLRSIEPFIDAGLWVKQIEHLFDRDSRNLNLFAAYGQPGTTILELGYLLRLLPGVTYEHAFRISMIIILSGATAACAALSSLLFRHPLAWITTVFILLPDRQYFMATPNSAAVIPLIVLIILSVWWLGEQQAPQPDRRFILLGGLIGFAAATRLDASFLTGAMAIMVLGQRFNLQIVPPIIAGAVMSFFLFDPYLWFTPVQHLSDLVGKFTIHYGGKVMPIEVDPAEMIRALVPATICFLWCCILLVRRRLSSFMPIPIMLGLSGVTLLTLGVILLSTTQNVRYLAPFLVAWEVILLALILESLGSVATKDQITPSSPGMAISKPLIFMFLVLHVLLNLFFRPYFMERLFISNVNI